MITGDEPRTVYYDLKNQTRNTSQQLKKKIIPIFLFVAILVSIIAVAAADLSHAGVKRVLGNTPRGR